MTEQIKEPIAALSELVIAKPFRHLPAPEPAPEMPYRPLSFKTVGIGAFFGAALCLSVASNNLFFKELLVAYSIIGMALLAKSLEKKPLQLLASTASTSA